MGGRLCRPFFNFSGLVVIRKVQELNTQLAKTRLANCLSENFLPQFKQREVF